MFARIGTHILLQLAIGSQEAQDSFTVNVNARVLRVADQRCADLVMGAVLLLNPLVGEEVVPNDESFGSAVLPIFEGLEVSDFARILALHQDERAFLASTCFFVLDGVSASISCLKLTFRRVVAFHNCFFYLYKKSGKLFSFET